MKIKHSFCSFYPNANIMYYCTVNSLKLIFLVLKNVLLHVHCLYVRHCVTAPMQSRNDDTHRGFHTEVLKSAKND